MGPREALQTALWREAPAYAFALLVWASGGILIETHGLPGVSGAFLFAAGALAGEAAALLAAFGSPLRPHSRRETERRVGGAFHLVGVMASLLVVWGIASAVGRNGAYVVCPFAAIVVFNASLALELKLTIVSVENE